MLITLEIIGVSLSILILVSAGMGVIRNAHAFFRTVKKSSNEVNAEMMVIMEKGQTAQEYPLIISGKMDLLQQSLFALSVAAAKMGVLIRALLDARQRILPALRYIGL